MLCWRSALAVAGQMFMISSLVLVDLLIIVSTANFSISLYYPETFNDFLCQVNWVVNQTSWPCSMNYFDE